MLLVMRYWLGSITIAGSRPCTPFYFAQVLPSRPQINSKRDISINSKRDISLSGFASVLNSIYKF